MFEAFSDHWPQQKFVHCTHNLPDLKPTVLTIQPPIYEFCIKFSSFSRLVRIVGWVQRFICRTLIILLLLSSEERSAF